MTIAVVARKGPRGLQFLTEIAPHIGWSNVERNATRFADVRTATRAAMTLSARHRAFALPQASTVLLRAG